ncbi:MAG: flagellin FliC [Bdellovibrionaceae bacterium]|nr:flagellin FliC [Pseudobdellovibrionaceae bacterium]MBX3032826.1 flagellin FliC [Pseudobdellovibrionaceae bacterium]
MGLRIQTNMAAISAQKVLSKQQGRAEHAAQALASGTRIVKAGDDAAGLAISESIRGQVRGMQMARMNSFNAISAVQVSEGGLNEISNILIRLRELGIQAASDNIGDREREFLNLEAKNIIEESDRIAKTTVFGDKRLLDGSGGAQTFHVGAFGGEENTITYDLSTDARADELGIDGLEITTKSDARSMLEVVDKAMAKVGAMRANFGAIQNRLETTTSNLDNQIENLSAAKSRIADTDIARETSEMASAQVLQQAAVSVLAQANQFPSVALKLI